MKKTILTLILFITTLSVTFAQETQSDATWEETTQFIKKNIDKFSHSVDQTLSTGEHLISNYEFSIEGNFLNSLTPNWCIVKIDLLQLKNVTLNSDGIKLFLDKNSVVSTFIKKGNKQYYSEYKIMWCKTLIRENEEFKCKESYWNESDEFVQRMYKAFKHLAYLANEKRKQSKF